MPYFLQRCAHKYIQKISASKSLLLHCQLANALSSSLYIFQGRSDNTF